MTILPARTESSQVRNQLQSEQTHLGDAVKPMLHAQPALELRMLVPVNAERTGWTPGTQLKTRVT
jgi:hypothetical protein